MNGETPPEFKAGDRVECDHYAEMPPLKGTVTEVKANGMIWVKLDIGGNKETFPPFIRKIDDDSDQATGKRKVFILGHTGNIEAALLMQQALEDMGDEVVIIDDAKDFPPELIESQPHEYTRCLPVADSGKILTLPTNEQRVYRAIRDHIDGKRTFREEYHLVLEKKSELPKAHRSFLVNLFESQLLAQHSLIHSFTH